MIHLISMAFMWYLLKRSSPAHIPLNENAVKLWRWALQATLFGLSISAVFALYLYFRTGEYSSFKSSLEAEFVAIQAA